VAAALRVKVKAKASAQARPQLGGEDLVFDEEGPSRFGGRHWLYVSFIVHSSTHTYYSCP
jgi:hypothetical protein